ncbi:MAG: transcriptional repressor NrdR [Ruminococcaceae bacterium]|nr:transcriptional repressor NrdR [Oscillospiraceae bacterium]
MKCPYCGESDSKVIDSRPADDATRIRRRRQCLVCAKRFTTFEIVETVPLMVVKKDKSREAFDREKLMRGLMRASYKRPVSYQMLEEIVNDIEQKLSSNYDREVTSMAIGELAMERLQTADEVAYVRFASVYRQFSDVNTFMDELKVLLSKPMLQEDAETPPAAKKPGRKKKAAEPVAAAPAEPETAEPPRKPGRPRKQTVSATSAAETPEAAETQA